LAGNDRDVLAELDDIEQYLTGLANEHATAGWGQDSNLQHLHGDVQALKNVAQNIVELHAEYSSGVTHEQRLRKLSPEGTAEHDAQSEIEDLRRQLAEVRGASDG
jgi:hypothetical protein